MLLFDNDSEDSNKENNVLCYFYFQYTISTSTFKNVLGPKPGSIINFELTGHSWQSWGDHVVLGIKVWAPSLTQSKSSNPWSHLSSPMST